MGNTEEHSHEIHYSVNGEPQVTVDRELTPVKIMEKAGINPSENFLVEIRGRDRISFKNEPTKPIDIHPNEIFVTEYMGPVPVSTDG
jgi:hypothetical protein